MATLREVNALLLRAHAFPHRQADLYRDAALLVERLDYRELIEGVSGRERLSWDISTAVEKMKVEFAEKLRNEVYDPSMAIIRARGLDKRVHNLMGDAKHTIKHIELEDKARRNGEVMIWIPEIDACPRCLEHAGKVIKPGETFAEDVKYPPLHNNCRCKLLTLKVNDAYELKRLRAEAQRIVDEGGLTGGETKTAIRKALTSIMSAKKPLSLRPLPTLKPRAPKVAVKAIKLPKLIAPKTGVDLKLIAKRQTEVMLRRNRIAPVRLR